MLLSKLAARHLPYPEPLRTAIQDKEVGVTFDKKGSVIYVIALDCENKAAVRAAIDRRTKWELWAAALEGALIAFVVLSAFAFLLHH
jgi:hypothetical protein